MDVTEDAGLALMLITCTAVPEIRIVLQGEEPRGFTFSMHFLA